MNKLALSLVVAGIMTMAGYAIYRLTDQDRGTDAISPLRINIADEPDEWIDRPFDTSTQSQVRLVWQAIEEKDIPVDLLQPDSDIHYLKISALESLEEGDRITFFIPQENSYYIAVISQVSTSVSGNRSLVGIIEGGGADRYRLLITIGLDQSFVTLNTPTGQYQMEVRNGIGKIISNAAIDSKTDHTKPDYIIPDRFRSSGANARIDSG